MDYNKLVSLLRQSGDEEELQSIKDEEDKIRLQIQETLVKSDELSVSIASCIELPFISLLAREADIS